MNNSSERFNNGNGRTFNPGLPAIIPPSSPPAAAPFQRRFGITLFRVRLILLAVSFASIASLTGFVTAALWPWAYRDKMGLVVTALMPENGLARDSLAPDNSARDNLTGVRVASDNLVRDDLVRDNEVSNAGDAADHGATVTGLAPKTSAGIDSDACQVNSQVAQLAVKVPPTTLRADEPALLGLTVDSAPEGAQLVICGFAANSVFSAGQSVDEKTWTLPASQIANATITPPRGFVGPMKLAVALVNVDRSLADRRTLDLQWTPQTPPAPSIVTIPQKVDDADLNKLLEQGVRLKAAGNLADARAIFTRIARAGDSRAAFMLAETYDPIALAKRQLLPPDSDIELARIWYRKASTLGSQEAPGRLERLTNW